MSGFDGLLVSQVLVQVPMPVFCCDLTPYSPALQMARQAIDDLRASVECEVGLCEPVG